MYQAHLIYICKSISTAVWLIFHSWMMFSLRNAPFIHTPSFCYIGWGNILTKSLWQRSRACILNCQKINTLRKKSNWVLKVNIQIVAALYWNFQVFTIFTTLQGTVLPKGADALRGLINHSLASHINRQLDICRNQLNKLRCTINRYIWKGSQLICRICAMCLCTTANRGWSSLRERMVDFVQV